MDHDDRILRHALIYSGNDDYIYHYYLGVLYRSLLIITGWKRVTFPQRKSRRLKCNWWRMMTHFDISFVANTHNLLNKSSSYNGLCSRLIFSLITWVAHRFSCYIYMCVMYQNMSILIALYAWCETNLYAIGCWSEIQSQTYSGIRPNVSSYFQLMNNALI